MFIVHLVCVRLYAGLSHSSLELRRVAPEVRWPWLKS